MTTDLITARKALTHLTILVSTDTRYYPKAKTQILDDLKIVSDCLNTDTITETTVQASQRLRVNLFRFRPLSRVRTRSMPRSFSTQSHPQASTDREGEGTQTLLHLRYGHNPRLSTVDVSDLRRDVPD